MPRPPEYENLIKVKAFEAVQPTKGAVAGFLRDAAESLEVASSVDPKRTKQRFTLAYEGFYSLVLAVLEFHEVRSKDSGRNLAIQRVALQLLGLVGHLLAAPIWRSGSPHGCATSSGSSSGSFSTPALKSYS